MREETCTQPLFVICITAPCPILIVRKRTKTKKRQGSRHMGETTEYRTANVAKTRNKTPKESLELLHLQADIEPDGSSAILSIHTTEGKLSLSITIEQMSATVAEMWEAGSTMISRQLQGIDKGRSAFVNMIRRAPLAATITPTVDKLTGDVVVVYRFPDRMPISVRVSQEQFLRARAAFSAELKRSSN